MARRGRPASLSHEQARALLAERLDWPLSPERDQALDAHLDGCAACRDVEAEHRAARTALHQLAEPLPPRDLPARTLAALDVEAGRLRRTRPAMRVRSSPQHGAGLAFASLVSIGLAVVVGTLLLVPGAIPGPTTPAATPFAIAPEELAYLRVHGDEVRLFRTSLDQVCPPDSFSCANLAVGVSQLVSLPRSVTVSGLVLDPAGHRAALSGRSGDRTTFYVMDLADVAVGGATIPPYAIPSFAISPSPSPTVRPAEPTPTHTPHASPGTRSSATSRPTSRTAAPTATAAASESRHPAASPSPSAVIVAPASSASPETPGAPSASPTDSTLPTANARAILTDVLPAGMPAAWSPDGSTLAFSAMPASGATGPDIYTWHPGDDVAVALTTDHASAFASWAGSRIVGSAAAIDPADPLHAVPSSFVIDPLTGERRDLATPGIWLPSVDPTGRFVVYWAGDLEMNGATAVPAGGELLFSSWSALDPYVDRSLLTAPPEPSPVPVESAPPSPSPGPIGSGTPSEAATTPEASLQTVVPPDATPAPLPAIIRDWLIGWSADGSAFGVWLADQPGADVGVLSVEAVDPVGPTIDRQKALLPATPATRAFSCGRDRVAWTTPVDAFGHSELRIVVWGSFGRGELRSRDPEERPLLPAF